MTGEERHAHGKTAAVKVRRHVGENLGSVSRAVQKKDAMRAGAFELDCGGAENDSVGTERPSPTCALLEIARV
jgi:hypothetical protein